MKNIILYFAIAIFLLGCKENNQSIVQGTIEIPTIYGTWKGIESFPGVGIPSNPITSSCTYTFKEDGSIIYNRESFSCKGKYYLYEDISYYDPTDTDTLVAIRDLECDMVNFNCGLYFLFDDRGTNDPTIFFIDPVTMILRKGCIEGCSEKFEKVRINH